MIPVNNECMFRFQHHASVRKERNMEYSTYRISEKQS